VAILLSLMVFFPNNIK